MLTIDEHVCSEREHVRVLFDTHCDSQLRAQVAEHLVTCADCRNVYEQLAADDSLMRKMEARHDDAMPTLTRPDVAQRVQDLLRQYGVSQVTAGGAQVNPADAMEMLSPAESGESLGRLAGFDVVEVLGHGGMGVVFKAFDAKLNRFVAIKVLGGVYANNPISRQRFLREARAVAAVVHEHVIGVFAVEEVNSVPVMVMEYVAGGSLQDRIKTKGMLEVGETLRIALHVAKGLQAAHAQGIIHRDIKPANILLENDVERAKITDFGLARAVDDVGLTQDGAVAGTPEYMSPEQAQGQRVDCRSDFFSLGCLIYAMLTGHSPFRASSTLEAIRRVCDLEPRPLRELNSNVMVDVEDVVSYLLRKNPTDRPQNGDDVVQLLEQLLSRYRHPLLALDPLSIHLPIAQLAEIKTQPVPAKNRSSWVKTVFIILSTIATVFLMLCYYFVSSMMQWVDALQKIDLTTDMPRVEGRVPVNTPKLDDLSAPKTSPEASNSNPPTPPLKLRPVDDSEPESSLPGPVFEFPKIGQELDLEGQYQFKVQTLPGAEEYLWRFSQAGNAAWENQRYGANSKGPSFSVVQGSPLWRALRIGELQIGCRARVNNEWTTTSTIQIILRPARIRSSKPAPSQAATSNPSSHQNPDVALDEAKAEK